MKSVQVAKTHSVFEFGIGEEVPFTLLGWVDDQLALICQTSEMFDDRTLRFQAIQKAAHVLRRAWGCTSLTFAAEGFCALDSDSFDKTIPLPEQFASGNKSVAECLTFMHVDIDDINIVTVPYKYGLGRSISYGLPRVFPKSDNPAYAFPLVLQKSFDANIEELPDDYKTFYDTIASGLLDIGIRCQWLDTKNG